MGGLGFGAAMATASDAIMNNAAPQRAGMAASIEEVSYELGGAMGVTFLGSLMSVLYTISLPESLAVAPQAYDSLDEALLVAQSLDASAAHQLMVLARSAFDQAFKAVLTAAGLLLVAAAVTVRLVLPRLLPHHRPGTPHPA